MALTIPGRAGVGQQFAQLSLAGGTAVVGREGKVCAARLVWEDLFPEQVAAEFRI